MGSTGLRVLITGAAGFIGRRFLANRHEGWSVVALSRSPVDPRPDVTPARWSGPDDELPAPASGEFDVTIHLAGSSDHGLASREPWRDAQATAVTGAAILGRVRTRRIVLLSSAAVYAGLDGQVDPGRCLAPETPYALSKRYVEGLVAALVAQGRALDAIVIRLYNAYGVGERPTRLVPRVVAAIQRREPFVLTGDPASLSDPLDVGDVVLALQHAATADALPRDAKVTTFDLCGGDPWPLGAQVGRIAAALDRDPPELIMRPNPSEVPIRFWSTPEPARRSLALPPFTSFPEGIRRYVRAAGLLP